jgi:hypothetical protein
MDLATNRVLRVIARLLQVIVAVVFLIAAALKAFDPQAFSLQIAAYNILPRLSTLAAWCFIIAEAALAFALIVNLWPRFVTLLSITLLLLFIVVTARMMLGGASSGCGCFGALVHRSPAEVIAEDALMLFALLFSFLVLYREKARGWGWKLPVTAAGALLMAAVAMFGKALPVDALATELRPGAEFASFPLEGATRSISTGTYVVFLFSVRTPSMDADASLMNTIAQHEASPPCFGMLVDGPSSITTAKFQYGLAFPLAAIEPRFARSLYRTLPRAFILRNGKVIEVWSRIPATDDVLRALQRAKLHAPWGTR